VPGSLGHTSSFPPTHSLAGSVAMEVRLQDSAAAFERAWSEITSP